MALKLNDPMRSVMVNALAGTFGTAMLRIHGGSQPTVGGGTIGTQGTLCEINGVLWNAGSNGTATITASKTGTAGSDGTASWARLSGTDGTGFVLDGACSTSGTAEFTIDSPVIANGAVITLAAATLVQPAS